LEKYFAVNICFEPLVGELFRSGFIMQMAAAQNDFITPTVVSAAEGDYQRNLANSVELLHMLTSDETHGAANRSLFGQWLAEHGALALAAAKSLQPIWSLPHAKVSQFADVMAAAQERVGLIAKQIGVEVPNLLKG
jgi:propane 2-monooxygenase small subunit